MKLGAVECTDYIDNPTLVGLLYEEIYFFILKLIHVIQ